MFGEGGRSRRAPRPAALPARRPLHPFARTLLTLRPVAQLALDNMDVLGNQLKVTRPRDYEPVAPELNGIIIPAHIGATVKRSL